MIALHREIALIEPWLDDIRLFKGLLIRIRDKTNLVINIEFPRLLAYRFAEENYALDAVPVFSSRREFHWLYEAKNSEFLAQFCDFNPHLNPNWDLKHYVIITLNEISDVIAFDQPQIFKT
jgi:hypothetical protein